MFQPRPGITTALGSIVYFYVTYYLCRPPPTPPPRSCLSSRLKVFGCDDPNVNIPTQPPPPFQGHSSTWASPGSFFHYIARTYNSGLPLPCPSTNTFVTPPVMHLPVSSSKLPMSPPVSTTANSYYPHPPPPLHSHFTTYRPPRVDLGPPTILPLLSNYLCTCPPTASLISVALHRPPVFPMTCWISVFPAST